MSNENKLPDMLSDLRQACRTFDAAAERFENSMQDGINVHGALSGLVGNTDILQDSLQAFMDAVKPSGGEGPVDELKTACRQFLRTADAFEDNMSRGFDENRAQERLVEATTSLTQGAEALMESLRTQVPPTREDVLAQAKQAAYIRTDDDCPWLRIDSVDDVDASSGEILAHDENTMAPCELTLHVEDLDPQQVSFMKLVEFKL